MPEADKTPPRKTGDPAPADDDPEELNDPSATLAKDVARLQAESADWKEKALRARADYDNLQKRTSRDAALDRERQKARVLEQFLPLVELAHMAAAQAKAHPGPLSEGLVMLSREFDRMLEREGVTAVREVGVPFDPAVHEALATEAAEDVAAGQVSRIIQPGYRIGDKVLRFAKVAVAPPLTDGPG